MILKDSEILSVLPRSFNNEDDCQNILFQLLDGDSIGLLEADTEEEIFTPLVLMVAQEMVIAFCVDKPADQKEEFNHKDVIQKFRKLFSENTEINNRDQEDKKSTIPSEKENLNEILTELAESIYTFKISHKNNIDPTVLKTNE